MKTEPCYLSLFLKPAYQVQDVDHIRTGHQARVLRGDDSLRSIARLMGISPAYLSDLERGRRNWSPHLVLEWNKAINQLLK